MERAVVILLYVIVALILLGILARVVEGSAW